MPASQREITREDLVSDAEFALHRKDRRSALLSLKRLRRVPLGPYCTFYFECFETMLFQVQEMLLIEKGGEAQIEDELSAYNPLIPQGSELVATMMFELDDPVRREAFLGGLGGVEDHFYLEIGGSKVVAEADSDTERSRDDGKTSSVHFLRFPLADEEILAFRNPATRVILGCDDSRYPHLTMLGAETRTELARDLKG
jgi:hypothetical protein